MNWYWPRTVVHIVAVEEAENTGFPDMAPSREVLMEGMTYLSQELPNRFPGDEVSQVPQRYMDAANLSNRLSIDHFYFSQVGDSVPRRPPPQVQTLNRSRSRRGRQAAREYPVPVDVPSTSFRPQGPSTHEFGGSSTQPGSRESYFDLNVVPSLTPMLPEPYFPTNCYTPTIPDEPARDLYAGPSRSNVSPVSLDFSSDWSWPDLFNMTNVDPQPATPDSLPPAENEQGSWWLARDRERRPPMPRGPCMTSERQYHDHPDEPGDL